MAILLRGASPFRNASRRKLMQTEAAQRFVPFKHFFSTVYEAKSLPETHGDWE